MAEAARLLAVNSEVNEKWNFRPALRCQAYCLTGEPVLLCLSITCLGELEKILVKEFVHKL